MSKTVTSITYILMLFPKKIDLLFIKQSLLNF